MKKFTTLLMLFVLGVLLCPVGQVFAEQEPETETPELYDGVSQVMVLDIGTVTLEEDPAPDTEPCE